MPSQVSRCERLSSKPNGGGRSFRPTKSWSPHPPADDVILLKHRPENRAYFEWAQRPGHCRNFSPDGAVVQGGFSDPRHHLPGCSLGQINPRTGRSHRGSRRIISRRRWLATAHRHASRKDTDVESGTPSGSWSATCDANGNAFGLAFLLTVHSWPRLGANPSQIDRRSGLWEVSSGKTVLSMAGP